MDCCSVKEALIITTLCLLVFWLWKSWRALKIWETIGVPGPKPNMFIGNVGQMIKLGFCDCFLEWGKKYGKIYGIYFPKKPSLVVTDLDVVRVVTSKNFNNFSNRTRHGFVDFKPWEDSLPGLRGDHWKYVRSQLSPTFSSGKLKKMMPAISRVIENLNKHIAGKASKGEDLELKEVASCFTMDVIAGAAFGMHADSISNLKDPFGVQGRDLVSHRTWVLSLTFLFPWLGYWLHRLFNISFISVKATNYFLDIIDAALKDRRRSTKTYGDFLQLLVEAEREGATGPVDKEIDHAVHLITSKQWDRKGMNDDEIRANALLFLLAGYDTTSTVLSFTLFMLAGNPEVQRKAQQEVDAKIGKNPVTYESVGDLTYLEMCINEAIRLFPPGIFLDREVAEDCELGGYKVEKGSRIVIPVYAIHRDPEQWPDPERFDPERHTPEARAGRHPFAFLPFGQGPRNCIGMRLAQLEIRMVIASLLQRFTVTLTDKSVYPPVLKAPQSVPKSKDGLLVKFKPRV